MLNKVETSEDDQNKLIEFILLKIKGNKKIVEKVKTNRPEPQLRLRFFVDDSDDEIDILNQIVFRNRMKILERSPSNVSLSNEYTTEILTLLQDLEVPKSISEDQKIPAKTQIYFISADPSRKVSSFGRNSAQLKPSKFMFKGKTISEKDLSRETKNAFENIKSVSRIKPEIKQFCMDLLDQIESSPPRNNNGVKIKSELGEKIEPQDINTIAKNFGEILGALWYMKVDPEDDEVNYPSRDNEQIVDYTIHTNRNNAVYYQPISAKSGKGAPSAVSGLISREKNRLMKMKPRTNSLDSSYNSFLLGLCSLSLEESIIYANTNLNIGGDTEAFKNLREKIKTIKMRDKPSDIIKKINDYINATYIKKDVDLTDKKIAKETTKKFIEDFSDFFSLCPYSPDLQKVTRVITNRSKNKIDLLLYPLGRAAINFMNDNSGLVGYFNLIMKNSGIAQVSIHLTKDTIRFNLFNDPRLEASKGLYYFEYNSSYEQPKNKGISFKLL